MVALRPRARSLLLFTTTIILAALCLLPPGAAASPPLSPSLEASGEGPTLVDYLRGEIRSDDPDRREHALMDVVTLATCAAACVIRLESFPGKTLRIHNDSDFGSVIDVSALSPDLIWAYRVGPTDGLRLLALAGLLYIGDEASLERVLTESWAVPPAVRRTTHRRVADFFVDRYPSLEKQVRRTQTLSWTDIHTARKAAQSNQDERLTTRYPPPLRY
jgi:hypothetical protein